MGRGQRLLKQVLLAVFLCHGDLKRHGSFRDRPKVQVEPSVVRNIDFKRERFRRPRHDGLVVDVGQALPANP